MILNDVCLIWINIARLFETEMYLHFSKCIREWIAMPCYTCLWGYIYDLQFRHTGIRGTCTNCNALSHYIQYMYMKWLRYQKVISLKIQVGNTNQRNKWANTDPRIYRRWDQVPRSKHPLLIDHTRREPSSMIMNAELSAVKVSVSSTV
jgi:hypothetical protein